MASAEVCSALPKTEWFTSAAGTPASSSAAFAANTPRLGGGEVLQRAAEGTHRGTLGGEENDVGVLALRGHMRAFPHVGEWAEVEARQYVRARGGSQASDGPGDGRLKPRQGRRKGRLRGLRGRHRRTSA